MRSKLILALLAIPTSAAGHPGGLAADGCHFERASGTRHCHGAPSKPTLAAPKPRRYTNNSGQVYYPNCAAARAAGAAPVRIGQPGYASHLDRDADGVGCER
jgi:hypothetical protein